MLCGCILLAAVGVSILHHSPTKASKTPYYSWIIGDPNDVHTETNGVSMIQGGGTDQDAAMKWMLRNSGGGDILVIRDGKDYNKPPENADAYNPYFYRELGVTVDSVETIFLNSREVAENPEVIQKIRNAECLFFTGGDQSFYFNYIRGTGMAAAIQYLQKKKRVPIGGTSAGCAIQGQYLYTALQGSVTSDEALQDPYNADMTLDYSFLSTPFLQNTVTDTHYTERNRYGRHLAFLARISTDYGVMLPRGIGLDEKTAAAIDESGRAWIYGLGTAYFIIQYRSHDDPETCQNGFPLDWYRDRMAVQVYKIRGTATGNQYFDLVAWDKKDTDQEFWYSDRGYFGVHYDYEDENEKLTQ